MKAIKYEYSCLGREFVCEVVPDPTFHDSRASVRIYEKKKFLFFNKVWLDTRSFWVYKYATLEDGVKTTLSFYLKDEEEKEEIQKKWKTALDKC
jgi:hypothetical protein